MLGFGYFSPVCAVPSTQFLLSTFYILLATFHYVLFTMFFSLDLSLLKLWLGTKAYNDALLCSTMILSDYFYFHAFYGLLLYVLYRLTISLAASVFLSFDSWYSCFSCCCWLHSSYLFSAGLCHISFRTERI